MAEMQSGPATIPLGALITQLRDDAYNFATAELNYVKGELNERSAVAVPGIAMLAIAVVLAISVITALLVGLILSLIPILTALGATAVVIGVSLVIIAILARVGLSRLSLAFKPMDVK